MFNVYKPVTDVEGIDLIVVKSGLYHPLFIQVKSDYNTKNEIHTSIGARTFVPHKLFYIVAACFNPEKLDIEENTLFIPSKAIQKTSGANYGIHSVLDPNAARGKMKDYIIRKIGLASKIIEIFNKFEGFIEFL